MEKLFADIAVELPVEGVFSYSIPPQLKDQARLGKRVLVPFGMRKVTGYIVELKSSAGVEKVKVKDILDVLDEAPLFDKKKLEFFRWLATYYFAPLGEVLALTHPAGLNVKSFRYFRITEAGERLLIDNEQTALKSKTALEVLRAAGKGVSLSTLLKRFKGVPVFSTIETLKKKDFLIEEVALKGGGWPKFETFVSIPEEKGNGGLSGLRKKPLQTKVFNFLKEKGETPLKVLRGELGSIDHAVKSLARSGLVKTTKKELKRDPLEGITPRPVVHEPNQEQERAIKSVLHGLHRKAFSPFLLYGVTGSGKTLVYLKVLEEAVKRGKKAIYLIPEIALTPWPAAYLSELFPKRVAVFHSGLSEGERYDEWRRIVKGEVDIVVGTRSALFSPLKDLGLIIVDEEHDPSYKQVEGVKYNARDTALMLGKKMKATVLLGSATPSVETFYNSRQGKITPLYLKRRVPGAKMPGVEVMDMRPFKKKLISEKLEGLLGDTLDKKHQSILFLNRRGYSNFLICRDCGCTFRCLNCSVTLTFHKRARVLKCHYCDFSISVPDSCPACKGIDLRDPGLGTEKVEDEVRGLFHKARVGRMDRDTTRKKGSAKRIIDAVEEKTVDVLIGTQMVSKGHHFPGITLVGIISGDTSLNIPDFRSAERTFQLLNQASGRAGRGEHPGTVVIQTLNPDHYCLRSAATHDYEAFFEEELKLREEVSYPPFTRLCNLRLEGAKEDNVASSAMVLKSTAEGLLKKMKNNKTTILGPAPALLKKLKGRYRWQLLVKGDDARELHTYLKALKEDFEKKKPSGVSLTLDMDPVSVV